MYELKITSSFKHDLKAVKKQGKKIDKLNKIVDLLIAGEDLPEKCHNHLLSGEYAGLYECHIEPDWLLIYLIENDIITITLTRTGSHSDLFG